MQQYILFVNFYFTVINLHQIARENYVQIHIGIFYAQYSE